MKCIYFYFQPVDLLPFRIEDARRQLEADGDFSFEGLQILREAEDERRGKKIRLNTENCNDIFERQNYF